MSILSASSIGLPTSTQLAVSGLVSGIDTGKVIEGLLTIEQQKIQVLDRKKTIIQGVQTAFKGIEARLLALQGQMTQLSRTQNGVFEARTVASSDETALTAAASSSAVAGVYQMRIASLAKAHQVASQGFDTVGNAITHGTLQIKVGDKSSTITVDGSNDTLQGLVDTINSSGASVTASVVNDGSGEGTQGYRLLLSSKSTGVTNRIILTNNLGATGGGATNPIFNAGSVSNAILATGNTSTSSIQSNVGANFTGTSNNVYTFTVIQGGTVGTDNNLQIAYSDTAGVNTGTITVNAGDVNVLKDAAQGIRVQFASGTLVAGDKFTVKAFVPTVQDAADASVTLGSGAGAMMVNSATNQLDSLIPGVALHLQASDPAKDITLTVANDTEKMKKAIQDFVSSYNDVLSFIDDQARFDADSGVAGPLLGNRQALSIQDQVRSVITDAVAGANPLLNHIGALGITTGDDGKLVVNDTKLADVLAGNRAGVSLGDVRKLFALTGAASNPGIQFVTGSTKTRASTTPYNVQITQAAEKAALTATTALAVSTIINGANNTLVVKLDGATSGTLTLAAGTYTPVMLAQALQSAINSDAALAGRHVSVGLIGNKLSVTSDRFGLASEVTTQSGTSLATLGFAPGAAATGRDVVGSFLVDGEVESAHGSGQFLLGDATNANTADLQVRVALSAAQVGGGLTADLSVTRGVASRLDNVLANLFDPINGRLNTIDSGFQASLDHLDEQSAKQNEIMESRRVQLQKQFAAMERVLSQLQSASNFLSGQATSLKTK